MKNTLIKILAVALLSTTAIVSLPAQTNATIPASLSSQQVLELEKQKLETERSMTINKQECEKTAALNAQDAEKSEIENGQDARKMMVHDLAWNSWVLAVLGWILMCGIFRHKRNVQMQETVRLMLEKGATVTPEIITALKAKNSPKAGSDPHGRLAWGLILVAVGIGLLIMYIKAGWIVLLIGAAFLILWVIERLTSASGRFK